MRVLMDAAIHVLKDVFSYRTRRNIAPGAVVLIRPLSRKVGGKGNFVHMKYIPYKAMRYGQGPRISRKRYVPAKSRSYHLSKMEEKYTVIQDVINEILDILHIVNAPETPA